MRDITLVLISPLKALQLPNGNILLTRKFLDGIALFHDFWEGPIHLLCEPADRPSNNLDNIEIDPKIISAQCAYLTDDFLRSALPGQSLVLSSVGEQFNNVSVICRQLGIPCVYITEYSLQTRLQIAQEYHRNPLRRSWSKLRQVQQELAQKKSIASASGVQCNGFPTYEAYRDINPSHHLFFDNRIEERMLATDSMIDQRASESKNKIRLLFSGRLDRMKGVDDLPIVADHLRQLGVSFEMHVCGDGELSNELRSDIDRRDLQKLVCLHGTMEFKSELVPFATQQTDLFVCCHRQGDPSCTYLETMACGVPIVGYANEAWTSLSDFAKTGWVTPIGDPLALASKIREISSDPATLVNAAKSSLRFAEQHTSEATFYRRVQHLKEVYYEAFRNGYKSANGPGFAA